MADARESKTSPEEPWDAGCLVEARRLGKRYQGFELSDVSLRIEAGSVFGLVGRNGSGKSTTIRCLLGLARADAGAARVLGMSPSELNGPGAGVKEHLGVVFDTLPFPPAIKVGRVGSIMRATYASWDQAGFERRLEAYGLPRGKACKDLSRGMGMKLQLACALSHDARLLVLDEATAGLDPMARDETLDELRSFVAQDGRAILMASHITSDLEKIADVVCCVDAGRVAFCLPKDEICDQMGVARVREADFGHLRESGACGDGGLRVLPEEGRGLAVLVPDYYAVRCALPEVACEHVTIEEYMSFVLKGELR